MYGVLDCSMFAQQFNTLAEMHGLGCCYLGTTLFNAPLISEVLCLPDRVIPLITLTVGYPAASTVISDRLPVKGIIHDGLYHDYSGDDIRELYEEKEALPENIGFVRENGKNTLAQVYAEVRYPRGMNEEFSAVLNNYLDKVLFKADPIKRDE